MTVDKEKVKEFAEYFNKEIYPVIAGEDGKGVERFAKIVEEKRKAVEARKAKRNQQKEQ